MPNNAIVVVSTSLRFLTHLETSSVLFTAPISKLEKMVKAKRNWAPEELQNIPGVGPSLAKDLTDLGYCRVSQLRGSDPEQMYQKLGALRGKHIDRCVLYVFRCAVYYASNSVHDPELLKWWNWKDEKNAI